MSTYAQNVEQMLQYAPEGDAGVKHDVILREYTRVGDTLKAVANNNNDNYTKHVLKYLDMQQKLIAARQKFVSDLASIRGANDRAAIMATQADYANIRTLSSQLAGTQNPAIATIIKGADAAAMSAAPRGDAAASAAAWKSYLGAMDAHGLITPANMYLPDTFKQMEMKYGTENIDPKSQLGMEIASARNLAEGALVQQVTTRNEMNAQLGELGGIASGLLNAENLPAMINQAKQVVDDAYANMEKLGYTDPRTLALDYNTINNADENYQRLVKQQEHLFGMLQTPDTRAQIGNIIGDPAFKEWADSNGFKIGTVTTDADGVQQYAVGRDDIRALRTFEWQQKHPNGGLIKDHDTGEWVAVQVKGAGRDVSVQGSKYEDLLGSASKPAFAYTTDEAGQRTYLTGEQVDAIIDAKRSSSGAAVPDPTYALEADDGHGGRTSYLYTPADGTIYELVAQPGEQARWHKSGKTLKDIGYDEDSAKKQGTLAVKTTPAGGASLLVPADIEGSLDAAIAPGDPEEIAQVRGSLLKSLLGDTGIEVSDKGPDVPVSMVYGKKIRQLANDPSGSIRIRTAAGETLIPPDKIAGVEVTARKGDTSIREGVSALRGRRDERIAKEGAQEYAAGGVARPSLGDRIASLGMSPERAPAPIEDLARQPKTRVAGEYVEDPAQAAATPFLEDPTDPQAILSDEVNPVGELSTDPHDLGAYLMKLRERIGPEDAPAGQASGAMQSGMVNLSQTANPSRPSETPVQGQLAGEFPAEALARQMGAQQAAEKVGNATLGHAASIGTTLAPQTTGPLFAEPVAAPAAAPPAAAPPAVVAPAPVLPPQAAAPATAPASVAPVAPPEPAPVPLSLDEDTVITASPPSQSPAPPAQAEAPTAPRYRHWVEQFSARRKRSADTSPETLRQRLQALSAPAAAAENARTTADAHPAEPVSP